MISRKKFWILVVVFQMLLSVSSFALVKKDEPITITIWGAVLADRVKGWQKVIEAYEKDNPGVKVRFLSMGAGGLDPQKLMTAIAGNVPPDIIYQGRFTIGDWASREAFIPLDSFVAEDKFIKDGIRKSDYYESAWNEAVYKGKVYGIPDGTDSRALYYNKRIFREAGLDPNNPPKTWEEYEKISVKLTKYNKAGEITQLGGAPLMGNSWLYLFAWQNEANFLTPDGKDCNLDSPQVTEALKWMVSFYDKLGGMKKVTSFGLQTKDALTEPFGNEKLAMTINGDWMMDTYSQYFPNLDYGVAPAPVPAARLAGEGRFKGVPTFITWSGGWSWSIPRGTAYPKESWKFIRFIMSERATRIIQEAAKEFAEQRGRTYIPAMSANRELNKIIYGEFAPQTKNFKERNKVFLDLMEYSKFRPVSFCGQLLWDEHDRATTRALYHEMTPQNSLTKSNKIVQRELDKVYLRKNYKSVNWIYPIVLTLICLFGFSLYIYKKISNDPLRTERRKKEAAAGVLFAMPWFIGFLVFTVVPVLMSIFFSFCEYDVLHPAKWVGLSNFIELFTDGWELMGKSLYNAGYLAVIGIPLSLIISLAIAMILNTDVRGQKYYRTIFYLPAIMPVVANAVLWIWILDPQYGLINVFWKSTLTAWWHIPTPLWLGDKSTAKLAYIIMGLWGAGGNMILWLAGLNGIPRHLYEAAELDGANWWARLKAVTLPMLTPYIFFNLIMGTIGVIQSFEAQYIMSGSGPSDSTLVPVLYLFNNAFSYFKMGYASAIAWVLFVIILVLTLLQMKYAKKWVYYEGEEKN